MDRRRNIQATIIGVWTSQVKFEKQGTNTFFFNMGLALQDSCSLEKFKLDFPNSTQQNFHFFNEGCK